MKSQITYQYSLFVEVNYKELPLQLKEYRNPNQLLNYIR